MAETKMSELLQRRELTGRVLVTFALLAAVAVAGLYGWSLIVPWLLDVAVNTTLLGIVCATAVLLAYGGWKFRTRASYMYASFVRWITARFVDLDPIGILNTYVARLVERLALMDEAIGSLNGQVKQLTDVIQENETQRQQAMARAEQAHKLAEKGGDNADTWRAQMASSSRQAKRLADSNKRLSKTLTQIEALLRDMRKLRGAVDVSIDDIKQNVDVMTREHRAITQGFAAFQQARRMLGGGGEEREMYEMTLDRLTTDYNEKMGQIDEFMETSKNLINGVDLDNMIAEDDALKEIEAKKPRVESIPAANIRVEIPAADAEDAAPDSFADLYKSKGKR